ncbi:Uncharacterised protein [Mycobacteroides abscessus subsp. abscessus]|nr:Uncharacterised protein [Mycobacteroides abscessus subsp. abscessus]
MAEAIAESREVTTAVVVSKTTGSPSWPLTWKWRISTLPGRISRSTRISEAALIWVRWAMEIWWSDWLVETTQMRVSSGSVVEARATRWCRFSSRYSATLLLVTVGSMPVRTWMRPDQPTGSTLVSIADRCRLAMETSRRWCTRRRRGVRAPSRSSSRSTSSRSALRESTPWRMSSSVVSSRMRSPPSDHQSPSRRRTSSTSKLGRLTMDSCSRSRPLMCETTRLKIPAT